ncbi:MAG: secondary thiamine-phosphate synthase enzyme YjbQ [Candidatus Hydrothermarchaeales archaeon]
MTVATRYIELKTRGDVDMIDITSRVSEAIRDSGLKDGIATVFVPGATGAVSTIEYEPGLLKDIPQALERIAPSNAPYEHHKTWGCDNGRSHVRATLIGPSLVVPFKDKKLILGTWQQIVFLDLDTSPRDRRLVFQIMGE